MKQVNTHLGIEILHWFKKNCAGIGSISVSADTQNFWYLFWKSGIEPALFQTRKTFIHLRKTDWDIFDEVWDERRNTRSRPGNF